MPVVQIKHTNDVVAHDVAKTISKLISPLVVQALSFKGCELVEEEIEIELHPNGDDDVPRKDIRIVVIAKHYPVRKRNLAKATQAITDAISASNLIPNYIRKEQISIMIMLVELSYETTHEEPV